MEKENRKEIYFAGGCFWAVEHLFNSLPGVQSAISGYANGSKEEDAVYEKVCGGMTGFKETVKVVYDAERITLKQLLDVYFEVIDPTQFHRQGNDIGSQYQTGIYYTDEGSKEVVACAADQIRKNVSSFRVEIEPLINFFAAEDNHQRYLDKNPGGYCHIPRLKIRQIRQRFYGGKREYRKPDEQIIRQMLSPLAYEVTQNAKTEKPYLNRYWMKFKKGIYVDVVTGEPLFSSRDKFASSCGWPAFSATIVPNAVKEITDHSFGMTRTEVKSRIGASHLGHVFFGESASPGGVRYCINSAALKFIPYEQMDEEGYGDLKPFCE